MPYVSNKQRKFFHAHEDDLKKQGVDVHEWDQASKGLDLPEEAPKKKHKSFSDYLNNP